MALFESKQVKGLKNELIQVMEEKNELELKVLKLFTLDGEFENYLIDKLELTSIQAAKLKLIFSVEGCRLCGVPEESIVHYEDWEKYHQVQ